MGNSLHNKIYLGRSAVFNARRWQLAMAFGVLAGIALLWAALRH
jgi:hypothetical protein